MKEYTRVIDELGRIVIPAELRQRLGLDAARLLLKPIDRTIVLQRTEDDPEAGCFVCKVDDLGRIVLPGELMQKQGWKEKDHITMYNTDNLVILKFA